MNGARIGILENGMGHRGRQKFMDSAEAATRQNQFPAHLRVAPAHELQEFNLLRSPRGEIRVATFGGHNANNTCCPKTKWIGRGPCRPQWRVPPGYGLPTLGQPSRQEPDDRCCAKIIHQHDGLDLHFLRQRVAVDDREPWHGCDCIRGNPEAGRFYFLISQVGLGLARDPNDELGKILTGKSLLVDHLETASLFGRRAQGCTWSRQHHQPEFRGPRLPVKPI